MDPLRDNPSEAERAREPTAAERYFFRWVAWLGVAGLAASGLALAGLIFGWLPDMVLIGVLFGGPVSLVVWCIGLSKGRDCRPTVEQMFAAGGRR